MGASRALAFAAYEHTVVCGPLPTGDRQALTVECWARADALGGGNRPLLQQWPGWALYVTADGRLVFAVTDADGVAQVAYSPPGCVPAGRWRHAAGVYATTGRLRVLLHGADVTEDADAPFLATGTPEGALRLGGYLYDDALPFVGRIGRTRVSAVARYGQSYAVPYRPPKLDAATLAQYDMQPTHGDALTVTNAAGVSALNGQISGATWTWGPQVGERTVQPPARPVRYATARATRLTVRRIRA